ncbi:cation transporting ATPase C-terminal domain-containing protein [Streptomyces olivaceoviridis]
MDGPSDMALAVDPVRDDLMRRPPRDPQERILNARRLLAVHRAGAVHRPTGTGPVSRLPRDRVNGAAGRTGRVRRARGGFPAVVARPTSERIGPTCAGAPIVARVSRKTARAEVQVFDLRQSHPFSMAKNRRLKWRQTAWSVRDP